MFYAVKLADGLCTFCTSDSALGSKRKVSVFTNTVFCIENACVRMDILQARPLHFPRKVTWCIQKRYQILLLLQPLAQAGRCSCRLIYYKLPHYYFSVRRKRKNWSNSGKYSMRWYCEISIPLRIPSGKSPTCLPRTRICDEAFDWFRIGYDVTNRWLFRCRQTVK